MLKYKIDVIKALKDAGYNSTIIYKERQISQTAMQKIRNDEVVGIAVIDKLCGLLHCQPGDLIEYSDQ